VKRVAVCVGGRPNYIKMSPIVRAIDEAEGLDCVLVDAQQHYDENMRGIFFEEVGLRKPDFYLGVNHAGSTHASITAKAMTEMEVLLDGVLPKVVDAVMVHGDMNYALGCALAAVKLHIPVIHNEAGLRSFDRQMPEEINRTLIDHIATTHLMTEVAAHRNLHNEGILHAKAVGSTLPETITYLYGGGPLPCWHQNKTKNQIDVTLHRPENVDDPERLKHLMEALEGIREGLMVDVQFYCHPRTKKKLDEFSAWPAIDPMEPCGYKHFIGSMLDSQLVITDSGGIQEETTILGVPCITWRHNTERPVTIEVGTNQLAKDPVNTLDGIAELLESDQKPRKLPPYWDGKASQRIVEVLRRMK